MARGRGKLTPKDIETISIVSNNINRLLDETNTKQIELSRSTGIPASTLTGYVKGTSLPVIGNVQKIADYFMVKKSDIDPRFLSEEKETKLTDIYQAKIKYIPLIGTIACGEPITAEQNIEEYIPTLDKDLPAGELFYLRAKGDSMTPKISDGSDVLCRAQPDVESGEIAAVLVNGDEEAILKKVHKLDGYVLLEALNEAYAPYLVNEDHPARIVGKAIKVVNDL